MFCSLLFCYLTWQKEKLHLSQRHRGYELPQMAAFSSTSFSTFLTCLPAKTADGDGWGGLTSPTLRGAGMEGSWAQQQHSLLSLAPMPVCGDFFAGWPGTGLFLFRLTGAHTHTLSHQNSTGKWLCLALLSLLTLTHCSHSHSALMKLSSHALISHLSQNMPLEEMLTFAGRNLANCWRRGGEGEENLTAWQAAWQKKTQK